MRRCYPFLFCSLVLFGCSPQFTITSPTDTAIPKSIAVLPADYSVDIPRERIDITRRALINALRNEHFVVMEDVVVDRICTTPQCPERDLLAQNYLVDGFVSIKLTSVLESNFLAGYYDSLSGEVEFQGRNRDTILKATHTERSRGGLIFESGQILQGLSEQLKRSGDSGFEKLAEKFTTRIAQGIPGSPPATQVRREEGTEVVVSAATADWASPQAYKVCVQGTPHSFASLLLAGQARASLRETSPGSYCGVLSALTAPPSGVAQVDLRTAFGNSVRQDVVLPIDPPCTLQNRINITRTNGSALLSILCARVGNDRSHENLGCSPEINQCSASKIVVFSSPNDNGPFTKIAEMKRSSSTISRATGRLRAIAIGAGGVSSQATPIDSTGS